MALLASTAAPVLPAADLTSLPGWLPPRGKQGLSLVFFNYPQHLEGLSLEQARELSRDRERSSRQTIQMGAAPSHCGRCRYLAAMRQRVLGAVLRLSPAPPANPHSRQAQVQSSLRAAGLAAGAVCTRFPPDLRLGAFSGPDEGLRQRAVALAVEGCRWAADLGAPDLVVWSPYDGYDYFFEVSVSLHCVGLCGVRSAALCGGSLSQSVIG